MSISINLIDEEMLLPERVDERYINSPFHCLKTLHPKQAGSRYERITESVLQKLGYDVRPRLSPDHDRIVNGKRSEIKGSCLNRGTNNFSFLQIRPNQEYDEILFTMFYPNELVIMSMTKNQVLENIRLGIFKKQHGGKKTNSGTFMYYGNRETLLNIGAKEIQ